MTRAGTRTSVGQKGVILQKRMERTCQLSGYGNGYPEALDGIPYFSWKCTGMDGKQSKYRMRVQDRNGILFWESDWVQTDQSEHIPYEGTELEPDHDYQAEVIVEDLSGNQITSVPELFSTGLGAGQWQAQWLRPHRIEAASPLFRKEFSINKEVIRAKLYICGLGYQETYLNGTKIGRDVLSPAWTDYKKRVSYNTYDISDNLPIGDHVLDVQLGNGWYGMTNGGAQDRLQFLAQISIEYGDGQKEWICTKRDDGWYVNSSGPLKYNSLYIGEIYDARSEMNSWKSAILTEPPEGILVPQALESIEEIAQRDPITISEPESHVYVADFGQNMAGVIEITLEEAEGTRIQIRYAEILDKNGGIHTDNLRTAQAKDIYIAKGQKEQYRPRFTYHGFRYIEVTGLSKPLQTSQIKAIVLRNAVCKTGSFVSGNDLINQIQTMCQWTESNNMHGVPTDCPQRDERLGWLNDLTVRAEEAIYNFDLHRFYTKYLQDIRDAQGKVTGAITDTAPFVKYGNQPADPVCSSYLILGWLLYLHYGDKQILQEYYEGFAAWTHYLADSTEHGIVNYSYYGDWAAPIAGSIEGSYGASAVSSITPGELMSTGYLYYNAVLMSQMAEVLNQTDEIGRWNFLAEETKKALNKAYYHPETGSYATNSQASNTFMAWLSISPDMDRTVQAIVDDIYRNNIHLTTGNLCTRYLLEVLTEHGYIDLAYELVTQTTYPSWGYMVAKGATTTWERWEYVDSGPLIGMASHDHPMYATVSAWFYRYLMGVQPIKPGYQEFRVQPFIPAKLPWIKGTLETIKGEIIVEWKQNNSNTMTSNCDKKPTNCNTKSNNCQDESGIIHSNRNLSNLFLGITVPCNTRCNLVIPTDWQESIHINNQTVNNNQISIWLDPGFYEVELEKRRI